jgi:hypothetical protein
LIAAKFLDDFFYNNAFYAKLGGISTQEMNALELEFLLYLGFSLKVSSETYLAYFAEMNGYLKNERIPSIVHSKSDDHCLMPRCSKDSRSFGIGYNSSQDEKYVLSDRRSRNSILFHHQSPIIQMKTNFVHTQSLLFNSQYFPDTKHITEQCPGVIHHHSIEGNLVSPNVLRHNLPSHMILQFPQSCANFEQQQQQQDIMNGSSGLMYMHDVKIRDMEYLRGTVGRDNYETDEFLSREQSMPCPLPHNMNHFNSQGFLGPMHQYASSNNYMFDHSNSAYQPTMRRFSEENTDGYNLVSPFTNEQKVRSVYDPAFVNFHTNDETNVFSRLQSHNNYSNSESDNLIHYSNYDPRYQSISPEKYINCHTLRTITPPYINVSPSHLYPTQSYFASENDRYTATGPTSPVDVNNDDHKILLSLRGDKYDTRGYPVASNRFSQGNGNISKSYSLDEFSKSHYNYRSN